ncbi:MAG: hypothetical protein P8X42_17995 [Calditrichaceae bacterium]
MRQSFFRYTVFAVACVILSISAVFADTPANVNWDRFSEGLVQALQSDNAGLQQSAMQLVIRYGDKVDVGKARFDVMDTFLYSKDRKVRQLALITLSKINNTFDMGLLYGQLKFEKDPVIKRQIAAVLIARDRLEAPAKYASDSQTVTVTNLP